MNPLSLAVDIAPLWAWLAQAGWILTSAAIGGLLVAAAGLVDR